MRNLISLSDVLIVAGIVLCAAGLYLIEPVAVLVFAGVALMTAGYLRI